VSPSHLDERDDSNVKFLVNQPHSTLARLLSVFPEIVIVLDADGKLLWANDLAQNLFSRSLDESIGISVIDFVHPDDLEMVLRSFETVQGKQMGNPIEVRVKVESKWRLLESIGVPVSWYQEGAILFSIRDLTDRRRFEVARDDVARFRSLVHNATTIMLFLTPDGSISSVSGALTRMLGHDPEIVENKPLSDIVVLEDRARLQTALKAALAQSSATRPVTVGVRMTHHASADLTEYELSIVSLVDDPTVQGLVVTAHDVSARVAAELELQRTLLELRDTFSLLSATLDSTADGLLVVDRERQITSFNSQFAAMWHLPDTLMASGDDIKLIDFILDQLEDPEAFVTRVDELYAQPNSESNDTLTFKDGRVFDRHSKPQFMAGEIVGRVWSFSDITEQKRLENDLSHMAFHDTLTGLANRALFRDRLNQAMARNERSSKYVAVMFLDLDNFKTVNDSLGHSAGDELLKSVSEALSNCLRRSDTAARLGGDEFAVLIEDVDNHDEVMALAQRIMTALRQPVTIGSQQVSVTVSIGITFGIKGSTSEQLLRNADLAMYLAKAQGRDRYEEFQDQMHTAVVERLELEADLRKAVVNREFVVHYQPIIELDSSAIRGFEALVRWQHPTKGLLQPVSFVPFAEEIGLINAIDRFVLEEACARVKNWQESGLASEQLLVSVNLSARELVDTAITDAVATSLVSTGFNPSNLILEITESAVMRDLESAVRNLHTLKLLGLQIAIDDFGTGYSSFSHLERLPIDILKVDKSFVSHSTTRANPADLALAIVQLARTLGLAAIAEGVETESEAEHLREMGCVLAQGYHLGMPMSAVETEELLRSSPLPIIH
jgi:diguanylate cyclase (GGDEF)-like protein/PAS domain S-box-containing protein